MAKTDKNKFTIKKAGPSAAEVSGEYVVPEHQQVSIRELDKRGADLQKNLGALRQEYLMREVQLMQEFQKNRQEYEKTVTEIAGVAGIDLKAAAEKKQPWTFDLGNMTFKRASAQVEQPTAQNLQ